MYQIMLPLSAEDIASGRFKNTLSFAALDRIWTGNIDYELVRQNAPLDSRFFTIGGDIRNRVNIEYYSEKRVA